MQTIYLWILFVGLCTLFAIGWWYKDWHLEGFRLQQGFGVLPSSEPTLEWVQTPLDRIARNGNSCRILQQFPDEKLPNAVIEIVDSSCESGLPHTVGTTIIRIPESAWNSGHSRREHILAHERIHLLQRRNHTAWTDFYRNEWEYTVHASPPDEISETSNTMRGNPDTFPNPWACWRNRYWFAPLYESEESPKLQNAHTRIWDSRKKEWLNTPPYEWRVQFCHEDGKCPYQSEHPAEISAEYAADLEKWHTPAALSLRRLLEFFPGINK